jgi:hypothetical protein
LPLNKTTWYLYYISNVGGSDHFNIVKSFDSGQTWGTPQIASMPEQPNWRSHRPAFIRYGDNFYLILNIGGTTIACYNSTDGEHWGNKQIIHEGDWYVPHGVMIDQSHILWTDSALGYFPGTGLTGKEFGGVFEIPEMIAGPGKPSGPNPSNGAIFPEGTNTTTLKVMVHGDQTYDVAFYWANGSFIGEEKLLQEGDMASANVSGLSDDEAYSWYAIARGTTYGYWGHEPRTTSDENRSDTFSFTVGIEPKVEMDSSDVTCHKNHEQFTIQVNLTDVASAHDFAFETHYNTILLDYVNITWGTFLDGIKVIDNIDEAAGVIEGHIEPSTLASGAGWLLNITFEVNKTIVWKDCPNSTDKLEGEIWFHWVDLSYPDDVHVRYEEWEGGRREMTVNRVRYTFLPIQGDLDNDGDVDIFDLRAAGACYNAKEGDPEWPTASTYDLNCDGIIDIFDIILVALRFGST